MLVALLAVISLSLVCAADDNATVAPDQNATVTDTPTDTSTAVTTETTTPDTSVATPTEQVETSTEQVQTPEPETEQAPVNGKIRIAPTVQLRTLNSQVTQNNDAVVDCYMSNPPANDGDLVVFITTEVPTGVMIRSSQGSDEGNSGIAETSYTIKPGHNKNIQLHAICSETGRFPVTMNAQYYVGTDKDIIKTIGLATEFTVVEPSTTFHMEDNTTKPTPVPKGTTEVGGIALTNNELILGGGFLLLLIAIIGLALRR
jgi:hypothetical protein